MTTVQDLLNTVAATLAGTVTPEKLKDAQDDMMCALCEPDCVRFLNVNPLMGRFPLENSNIVMFDLERFVTCQFRENMVSASCQTTVRFAVANGNLHMLVSTVQMRSDSPAYEPVVINGCTLSSREQIAPTMTTEAVAQLAVTRIIEQHAAVVKKEGVDADAAMACAQSRWNKSM